MKHCTAVNVEYVLSVLFLTLKDVLGFRRCCYKCFQAAPSWCYAKCLVLKVLHKTDTSHISSMMSARSLILLLFALFWCRILGNLFYNTTCLLQIRRYGWKWGFEKFNRFDKTNAGWISLKYFVSSCQHILVGTENSELPLTQWNGLQARW